MAEVFDVQPLQVSDISPENLSDILSRISPVVLSDILSSKCPDISSDILPACVRSGMGTLAAEDSGWGPAGNTGSRGSRLRSGREHWQQRIAVEVLQGTQKAGNRRGEGGGEGGAVRLKKSSFLTWRVGKKEGMTSSHLRLGNFSDVSFQGILKDERGMNHLYQPCKLR